LNLKTKTKEITLDWDDISGKELKRRIGRLTWFISMELQNKISMILFRRSPSGRGFHIRIKLLKPEPEALTRFIMGDDARRILLDIFRPNNINNITWDVKKGRKGDRWRRI
jgi:hypothetical protein